MLKTDNFEKIIVTTLVQIKIRRIFALPSTVIVKQVFATQAFF